MQVRFVGRVCVPLDSVCATLWSRAGPRAFLLKEHRCMLRMTERFRPTP